ncbi:sodium- and chloride-dependent glycine transporter 1-like [Haliotis rubra]|uniref:sodium- and chloride-dependent glycine transporter 1-like n=1 Tax=Haliotis rubra TaxID=36100 RepID=UPI001EE62756|nr:sodium- and chloride-dependent glycine transporter 1-like [Haliotis rubra]XP_046555675.1 sodium- and chloride-dependent glycine transporter 1-like [Haliotis rubra]XP_046555676.1 sodium- and chloride-dependent glycine transporter 1-like [Haliotis rubra]
MAGEKWRHHLDYIITLLGSSIGSGAFIKFPYLCMRNGGGAFLIPFALFTIIAVIPCVFLDMVIGQFSQSGPVNVWNVCPPFKGIGVGILVLLWIVFTLYNAIFSWFAYFFYNSFFSTLPWAHCNNDWNTPSCVSDSGINVSYANHSEVRNCTAYSHPVNLTDGAHSCRTAAEEFWRLQVLQLTDGLEDMGGVRWPLVLCLAITYLIVFVCQCRGIRVTGKLVYVTVGVPLVLIVVFLIRGCLLPGSAEGMHYFIKPNFDKLREPGIWVEACSYALFSLNVGMGFNITMSRYNKINNNCLRDAVCVCIVDLLVTILVGFSFFSIIGHVAYQRGVTVEAFASSGFNLAFIVYPQVLTYLPLPQLWSTLTFIMLMTLEIDCQLPAVEVISSAFEDVFPSLRKRRWLITALVLLSSFPFAIIYLLQGGIYMLTLVEWFAYFPSVAVFAFSECIAIGWLYGTTRLQADVMLMWGKTIPRPITLSIKFASPLLLLIILGYSFASYRPPQYEDYVYPAWATGLGWMISIASIVPLPALFVWGVWKTPGNTLIQKLQQSVKPNKHWDQQALDAQAKENECSL